VLGAAVVSAVFMSPSRVVARFGVNGVGMQGDGLGNCIRSIHLRLGCWSLGLLHSHFGANIVYIDGALIAYYVQLGTQFHYKLKFCSWGYTN
jgi:hypothetical protein